MTQEIIYTSAPSGLKPGSRGFCTVVATRGLAKPLADQLEDLSGYRHIFLSSDANSALNPIVFSHLKLSIAGRTYHVLSRICDAGLDYTQRTNKLAHHVTLEPRELTPSGPAALLSTPGFMTTSWAGEPAIRESGPVPPRVDSAPGVCREWGRLTGDAGWGGFIAEALVADARKQVVLVYQPGTNVLALIAETLSLLPANRRWEATFCTYFTKLPPTVDCRWRCVVDGTPEAETLARSPTAIVVDLRKALVPPAGSPYVSAARTGIPVPQVSAPPNSIQSLGTTVPPDQDDVLLAALGATSANDSIDPQRRRDQRNFEPSYSAEIYGLAPPPVTHNAARKNDAMRVGGIKGTPRQSLRPVVLLSFAVVGLLGIGGLGTYLFSIIAAPSPPEVAANPMSPSEPRPIASEKATPPEAKPSDTPLPSSTPIAKQSGTQSAIVTGPVSENTKTNPHVAPPSKSEPSVIADKTTHTLDTAPLQRTPAASPNSVKPDRRVEPTNPKPQTKEDIYFPDSAITSGDVELGSVEPAETYAITIFFNDAVKSGKELTLLQSPKSANNPASPIVISQPPQKENIITSEPTPLAEISIPLATSGSPARQLRFLKRPALTYNTEAVLILQTSIIEVRCLRKDLPTYVQRFQVRPISVQPFQLRMLTDGSQPLPIIRIPKNSKLHLHTWIMAKGKKSNAQVVDKSSAAKVEFVLDDKLTLPLLVTLVDGANAMHSITQTVNYEELKIRDDILYDSLTTSFDKTPTLKDATLASAEKRLESKIAEARTMQSTLYKTLNELKQRKADSSQIDKEITEVTSRISRSTTSLERLRSLRNCVREINDGTTSSQYSLHLEIHASAGERSVVLLTTDPEKYGSVGHDTKAK